MERQLQSRQPPARRLAADGIPAHCHIMKYVIALSLSALPCAAQEHWRRLAPIPESRGVAAPFAGVSGNALIVAGGANFPDKMPWEGGKKVWRDAVWVLDGPDGKWRGAGKLPRPLAYGVSVSVNGCVLCIGGSDSERHYADVFAFEWKEGTLRQSKTLPPSLPIPLANAAGAVDRGEVVYIACGSSEPGEKTTSNRVFSTGFRRK
jgi:N-acetylneuraminate epimerase